MQKYEVIFNLLKALIRTRKSFESTTILLEKHIGSSSQG